ncbi:MAG: hypothetical protein QXN15_11635 [Candidatus Jordarchaeales archaeon]|nr:hypothetical protein [Candidatus Jordarchaeia archaeon]
MRGVFPSGDLSAHKKLRGKLVPVYIPPSYSGKTRATRKIPTVFTSERESGEVVGRTRRPG